MSGLKVVHQPSHITFSLNLGHNLTLRFLGPLEVEKWEYRESPSSSASAPQSLHSKAVNLGKLSYTRSDLDELNNNDSERKDKWASDGLGGIFNGEGYTGRKDDGHRIFKAHLMNREGSGQSADCPFDCDCCFI